MNRNSKCLRICNHEFRKAWHNPRNFVTIIWIIIIFRGYVQPIREFAAMKEIPSAPWVLPHLLQSSFIQMMLTLGAVLIFCDAPFVKNDTNYIVMRSGKNSWLAGEILYLFGASVIYAGIVSIIVLLLLVPYVGFFTGWGKILGTLAQSNSSLNGYVSYRIILSYQPWEAFARSFFALTMNTFIVGLLIMILNMFFKRNIGPVIGTIVAFTPYLVIRLSQNNYLGYYFSLPSWMDISIYNFGDASRLPTLGYIYSVWGVLLFLLIGMGVFYVRRRDMDSLIMECR